MNLPEQQNLISVKTFVKRTGCLQPSNSLVGEGMNLAPTTLSGEWITFRREKNGIISATSGTATSGRNSQYRPISIISNYTWFKTSRICWIYSYYHPKSLIVPKRLVLRRIDSIKVTTILKAEDKSNKIIIWGIIYSNQSIEVHRR